MKSAASKTREGSGPLSNMIAHFCKVEPFQIQTSFITIERAEAAAGIVSSLDETRIGRCSLRQCDCVEDVRRGGEIKQVEYTVLKKNNNDGA